MSEWKETTLGEIAEIEMGQSPKGETCNSIGNGIPLLNGPTEFGIKNPKAIQFTIDSKRLSRPLDILFCVRGSTTGRMNWSDKEYAIGRGLAAIRHKKGIEYRYFLKGIIDYNLNLLLSSATGSTFPNVTRSQIEEIEINLPPLPEQKAIASVLSSLDDKIDLLHRQNKTLEQMAETLFRQWFVEEASEEWEEGVVADLAEHLKNSIKPQQNEDTLFNHYSIPSYDNGKEPVIEMGKEIKSNKYEVPTNCILFSKLNPHKDKRVWLLQDNLPDNPICSTEFQIVYPKNENSLYFLYGWLSMNENYREIASGVGGTSGSHQRISPSEIFDFRCPIIAEEQLSEYSIEVEPIYKKQFNNQTQIRTLEKLRDTLLPKLMRGEVRVKM